MTTKLSQNTSTPTRANTMEPSTAPGRSHSSPMETSEKEWLVQHVGCHIITCGCRRHPNNPVGAARAAVAAAVAVLQRRVAAGAAAEQQHQHDQQHRNDQDGAPAQGAEAAR